MKADQGISLERGGAVTGELFGRCCRNGGGKLDLPSEAKESANCGDADVLSANFLILSLLLKAVGWETWRIRRAPPPVSASGGRGVHCFAGPWVLPV